VFLDGIGDIHVRNVILKHEVDHVAKRFGEAGDFAIATEFARRWANGRRRKIGR
jgi:hypothetical protein